MSNFNVGDKVYLECEVKEKDMSDNTYKLNYTACYGSEYTYIKDDVLHTPDESYNKGLNAAWELAKKIVGSPSDGGYTFNELVEIFGMVDKPILNAYTPQEALAKVKEYEEKHDEIKAGDVVTAKGSELEGIVTKVIGRVVYRLFKDGSCDGRADKEDLVKTGKHFDSIDEFMKQED